MGRVRPSWDVGRHRPTSIQLRPSLLHFDHNLGLLKMLPSSAQIRRLFDDRHRPTFTELGKHWPKLPNINPNLAECMPTSTGHWPASAEFGQLRGDFGQDEPIPANFGPKSATLCSNLARVDQICTDLDQIRTDACQLGLTSANRAAFDPPWGRKHRPEGVLSHICP